MNTHGLDMIRNEEEAAHASAKLNAVIRELGDRLADGWSVKVSDDLDLVVEVSRRVDGVDNRLFVFCICHNDVEFYTDAALIMNFGAHAWRSVATLPLKPAGKRAVSDLQCVVVQHPHGESAVDFEARLYSCTLSAFDAGPRFDVIYGQTPVDEDSTTMRAIPVILDLDSRKILPVFPGGTVVVFFDGHAIRDIRVASEKGTVLLDSGAVDFNRARVIFQNTWAGCS